MPNFTLRYAPHLGYSWPTPLFSHSVGSSDPYAYAQFAAEHGFAGLFLPWAISRPKEEIARFKAGLRDFGLDAGAIAYAPLGEALRPWWVSGTTDDRELLLKHVEESARLANELGSEIVAVLIKSGDDGETTLTEMARAQENLSFAAEIAERHKVVIGIEPLVSAPGMLLKSTYAAAELIEKVDHPAVRLIFDTGHVFSMDGSILDVQASVEHLVCVYQLADMPDRNEPGKGILQFPELLARLISKGYNGLVELEYKPSADSPETEAAAILLLAEIDSEANRLAGRHHG
jgi:hydroxypyruvate isomerase